MAKTPSNKLSFKLLWVGCVIFLTSWSSPVLSFLEPGKWAFNVSQKSCHLFQVHKALYAGSMISIRILCDPSRKSSLSGFEQPNDLNVSVGWVVRQSPCYEEYFEPEVLVRVCLVLRLTEISCLFLINRCRVTYERTMSVPLEPWVTLDTRMFCTSRNQTSHYHAIT